MEALILVIALCAALALALSRHAGGGVLSERSVAEIGGSAETNPQRATRASREVTTPARSLSTPAGNPHDGSCYRWPLIRQHAKRIDGVLRRYGGPLAGYGHEIACAAKRYGVSPYLIIAIAGTESTFGKNACGKNPFGLGSCVGSWATRFEDYAEAIWYEARLLGEGYIDRGLTSVEAIGGVYAASSRWPATTRAIMRMFTSSERVTWR